MILAHTIPDRNPIDEKRGDAAGNIKDFEQQNRKIIKNFTGRLCAAGYEYKMLALGACKAFTSVEDHNRALVAVIFMTEEEI